MVLDPASPVQTATVFDPADLDHALDVLLDQRLRGFDVREAFEALVSDAALNEVTRRLAEFTEWLSPARDPALLLAQALWSVGQPVFQTRSCAVLAERFGISKQGFEQGALALAEKLDLRKSSNRHDGTEVFTETNFRRHATH